MDIKAIREQNLRTLRKRFPKWADLAEAIDTSPAYLSQVLSDKQKTTLGDVLARRIEQKLDLEYGWMDHIHEATETDALTGQALADLRRDNLRDLVKEMFHGNMTRLAKLVDRDTAHLSRVLSDNENQRRSVSDKLAREIEAACKLPLGYLDRLPDQPEQPLAPATGHETSIASEEAQKVIDKIVDMDHRSSLSKETLQAMMVLLSSIDRPQSTNASFEYPASMLDELDKMAEPNTFKGEKGKKG